MPDTPDVYELNGFKKFQGRPGGNSDGKNCCYSFTFLLNLSSELCDLTITTEDKGGGLVPGFIALNPDINPQAPDEAGVKKGVSVSTGKINKDGRYKEESIDGWLMGDVDGKATDPKKSADKVRIVFKPCIASGKATDGTGQGIRVVLCFDEVLDENDFIYFTPSYGDGINVVGGDDPPPSQPLTGQDILKILGGLGGLLAPLLGGKRMPNSEKRGAMAALARSDPQVVKALQQIEGRPDDPNVRRAGRLGSESE